MKKRLLFLLNITCSIYSAAGNEEHTITTITLQQLINILQAKSVPKKDVDLLKEGEDLHSKKVDLITQSTKKINDLCKLTESDFGDLFEEGGKLEWLCDQSSGNVKVIISQDKYQEWEPPLQEEQNEGMSDYVLHRTDIGHNWDQIMYNEMRSCLHLDSDEEPLCIQ